MAKYYLLYLKLGTHNSLFTDSITGLKFSKKIFSPSQMTNNAQSFKSNNVEMGVC